ncbi:MAG: YbjQ family protein [Phascolarctobacterium sp.]|nr:YbjQ family protein [Phascolarctobacterium sp.]
MLVTTTNNVEGRKITGYKGIVFGEVVSGMNFVKDWFAGVTDTIGGRSGMYEGELEDAREKALKEMIHRAEKISADAIIGVDFDYEVMGEKNGMIMVSCSGTAVTLD